jgi:hypothetical protein
MQLPITEVERLRLEPGDTLVLHVPVRNVPEKDAAELKSHVRELLGRPDLPILIAGDGVSVEVVNAT